jgi:capsular exopolysaccharide synthesis family protein
MKQLTLQNFEGLPYSVEEALNRLRVNFGFIGTEYKKIIITSSTPDEGKSFVAFNLWRMLAEAGKKVILVDADIRKSILRNRYKISGGKDGYQGLAFYLAGQAEMEDIIYATNIENGYMIPISYTVSNPAILLQSERFPKLLDALAEVFDYVLIDTPPLNAVADGDLIASHSDGAIFVIRGGVTPRKLIASSFKQLEAANCKLLGTVLNRVEVANSAYYYKYSKGRYSYNDYYSSYGRDSKPSNAEVKAAEKK